MTNPTPPEDLDAIRRVIGNVPLITAFNGDEITIDFGTPTQRAAWALVDQVHAAGNRGDNAEVARLMKE